MITSVGSKTGNLRKNPVMRVGLQDRAARHTYSAHLLERT